MKTNSIERSSTLSKISSNDTTPGFLEDKIVGTNDATVTTINDGSNEQIQIDVDLSSDIAAKVSKSGDTMTGDLDLDSHNLLNVSDGSNSGDAVNKGQLDLKVDRTDWGDNGLDYTKSTMSFVNSTRLFTITPTTAAVTYDVLIDGTAMTISAPKTITISDVEGIHYIYFDSNGDLKDSEVESPTVYELIVENAIVSFVLWDKTNAKGIFAEERHPYGKGAFNPMNHYDQHERIGAWIGKGGFLPASVNIGDGSSNDDALITVESGVLHDEDIVIGIDARAKDYAWNIMYLSGTDANIRWTTSVEGGVNFPMKKGTTQLYYNQNDSGDWKLTEVLNDDFVLFHVVESNLTYQDTGETTETKESFIIMGQNTYLTRRAARAGAYTEMVNISTSYLPIPEFHFISSHIVKSNSGYANDIGAKIVQTDDGGDFIDWRGTTISRVSVTTTNHDSLDGVQYSTAHEEYPLLDGSRDLTGVVAYDSAKTFANDQELVSKKYVDDKTEFISANSYNNAAQFIPNATWTKVTFNTLRYDYGSNYNTSTYEYTIPEDGIYIILTSNTFQSASWAAGSFVQFDLAINGTRVLNIGVSKIEVATTSYISYKDSSETTFTSGDVISMWIYQTSGGSVNIYNSTSANSFFIVRKLY